mgnify:CR=1
LVGVWLPQQLALRCTNRQEQERAQPRNHGFHIHSAGTCISARLLNTAALILSGKSLVFSNFETNGTKINKWKKYQKVATRP